MKPLRNTWFKLLVSSACLLVLLWWTDVGEVSARLREADRGWIGLALLAVTLATCSMADRWRRTGQTFGIRLTYPVALREYYLAQFINTVLPGGVTGDVARAFRVRHDGPGNTDFSRAAQSVAAERLLGQIAMLALMVTGFAAALVMPGGPRWGLTGWLVVLILPGIAIAAVILARRDTATGRFLAHVLRLVREPAMLVHGTITTLCLVLAFYACARAVGTVLPLEAFATVIPLVLCAMLVPLSIGGWGWREGAAAGLFPLVGASASAGVATGIAYGLVILAATLPACAIPFTNTFSTKRKPDPS